jgi:hypothetical protein
VQHNSTASTGITAAAAAAGCVQHIRIEQLPRHDAAALVSLAKRQQRRTYLLLLLLGQPLANRCTTRTRQKVQHSSSGVLYGLFNAA